jgi:hypothetical protein
VARAGDVDDLDGDDEALSWIGDEEQGRAAPRLRDLTAETATPETADEELEDAPGSAGRRAATVGFALPYLVLTIGWILAVQQLTSGATALFAEILWQFGEFLAILSAPFWFATTLSLTRDRRPLVRVGWLALGVGLLVPWPFVLSLLAALQFAGSLT